MNISESVIDALAAYRLTRLVTADSITARWRDGVIRNAYADSGRVDEETGVVYLTGGEAAPEIDLEPGSWADVVEADADPPKLAELVTCRWCAGVWVSFGVIAARRLAPGVWDPIGRALALSAGAALISRLETD